MSKFWKYYNWGTVLLMIFAVSVVFMYGLISSGWTIFNIAQIGIFLLGVNANLLLYLAYKNIEVEESIETNYRLEVY